jgi:hypothetical protein
MATKVAGISIHGLMRQPVMTDQGRRPASDQGRGDGVRIRVVSVANLFKRFLKKISQGDALANMEVPKGIYV